MILAEVRMQGLIKINFLKNPNEFLPKNLKITPKNDQNWKPRMTGLS